jgi:hypothetical protein
MTTAIQEARRLFDDYLKVTPFLNFLRQRNAPPDSRWPILYPAETIQTDMMAFAAVFSCLWDTLGDKSQFPGIYNANRSAFVELRKIVTPNNDGFARFARFWVQQGQDVIPCEPFADPCVYNLGRTLRNGLAHFNFRYLDKTPEDYFRLLLTHNASPSQKFPLPAAMKATAREPTTAENYRIFIIDQGTKGFLSSDPKSNTRIIETDFAHLRYHLFCFLARFFTQPLDQPYIDILTEAPLGAPPTIAHSGRACPRPCEYP